MQMSTRSGRPRKACGTCKAQKIRCTAEQPVCKRCLRLEHPCLYSINPSPITRKSQMQSQDLTPISGRELSTAPRAALEGRLAVGTETIGSVDNTFSATVHPLDHPGEECYSGIPKSLMTTLVDVYYENVYNASLLLHKGHFLESLAAGKARPHIVLGVCALAANFYRDKNGQTTLKDHGFMIEWAKRAGKLVFQELEDLNEDSVVTFCNLFLFWYSQGSWRISMVHAGNAIHLLNIIGINSEKPNQENPWESEMRRRHFWACYLIQCHSSERICLFDTMVDVASLTLPCPEEEFNDRISRSPPISMLSGQGNGGVFAELTKALTLWSTTVFAIKTPESNFSERIAEIHAIHKKLSDWWSQLRSDFKLTPSNLVGLPQDVLPNVLLMNIVYHQSLCALHASIVPLFSWGVADGDWFSARQLSAQVAFEHACTASSLIQATLSTYPRLSAMPSFISYASYCGCAIQIPFMWCLDPTIKQQANMNVKSNITMIHEMAKYWKIAGLLETYALCLYNVHKKHETVLENEPKYMNAESLLNVKIGSTHARSSILQFFGMLKSRPDGYTKPGEESNDLGIKDDSIQNGSQSQIPAPCNVVPGIPSTEAFSNITNRNNHPDYYSTIPPPTQDVQGQSQIQQQQQQQQELPQMNLPFNMSLPKSDMLPGGQTLDMFSSLLNLEMLDVLSNSEIPHPSDLNFSPLNLDYLDI